MTTASPVYNSLKHSTLIQEFIEAGREVDESYYSRSATAVNTTDGRNLYEGEGTGVGVGGGSLLCAQCLDDIVVAQNEKKEQGVDDGPCRCYCQDPSIIYCSAECRSLHWFVHKHSCPARIPASLCVGGGSGTSTQQSTRHHVLGAAAFSDATAAPMMENNNDNNNPPPQDDPFETTTTTAAHFSFGDRGDGKLSEAISQRVTSIDGDSLFLSESEILALLEGRSTAETQQNESSSTGIDNRIQKAKEIKSSTSGKTPTRSSSGKITSSSSSVPLVKKKVIPRVGKADSIPFYMTYASDLIADLQSNTTEGTNLYAGLPSFVVRDGKNSIARTQCATFISRLWKLSYGLSDRELKAWLQSDLVWGEDYYHHIVEGNGFAHVHHIEDVSTGDLIAMKYERTAFNTGHVMLVEKIQKAMKPSSSSSGGEELLPHTAAGGPIAKPPFIEGTDQYFVTIVDSTRTHHMHGDSRYKPALPGGIGRGPFRLYASASSGQIIGYTWSNWEKTAYYGLGGPRLFAVGRPVHLLDYVMLKEKRRGGGTGSKSTMKPPAANTTTNTSPRTLDDFSLDDSGGSGSDHSRHGSREGLDNFDFGSSGEEASSSMGETSDNGDTNQLLSIRCGEATEAVGKELIQAMDYKEGGIVWYSIGRSKRAGEQLGMQGMIYSAACYLLMGKYEAALRAADKVIADLDSSGLVNTIPFLTTSSTTPTAASGDADHHRQWTKLSPQHPLVLMTLAFAHSARANAGLGYPTAALQHFRNISFHVERWIVQLEATAVMMMQEEDKTGDGGSGMLLSPLKSWLSLQLEIFRGEISSLLRQRYPRVVLSNSSGGTAVGAEEGSSSSASGLQLTAAFDLKEGQLVLTEEPILVWADSNNSSSSSSSASSPFNLSFFKAYLLAPVQIQRTLLSMHTAELSASDATMLRRMLKKFLSHNEEELVDAVRCMREKSAQEAATTAAGTGGKISSPVGENQPGGAGGGLPSTLNALLPLEVAMKLTVIARCNSHSVEVWGDDEAVAVAVSRSIVEATPVKKAATAGADGSTSSSVTETFSCIYPMMSKVQHSCAPNMAYDGKKRAYFALRAIAAGELLTFSYAGRSCLTLSTQHRRNYIHSGFMFHCECPRCTGVDYSRGIKCGVRTCSGFRRPQGSDACKKKASSCLSAGLSCWKCDTCDEVWTETELKENGTFRREHALEMKLEELGPAIHKGELQKNQFEKLKQLILDANSEFGFAHWVTLEAMKLMVRFYMNISSPNSATGRNVMTRNASAKLGSKWTEMILRAAEEQKLFDHASVAMAEDLYTFTSTFWGKESCNNAAKLKAYRLVYPFFAASGSDQAITKDIRAELLASKGGIRGEREEVRHGSKKGAATIDAAPKSKKKLSDHSGSDQKQLRSRVFTLCPELGPGTEGLAISDLFEEWESYISKRVGQSLNACRDPKDLPPGLVEAMRRGGGGVVDNMSSSA